MPPDMELTVTMKPLSLSKKKISILLLENIHPKAEEIFRRSGYESVVTQTGSLAGEELSSAIRHANFLGIRSRTNLDAALLRSAKRLNAIGCFCIGTNQVDLDAAHDCGIPVFNAPFSNTRSVAELVLAEMILLMRGVPERNASAHRGEWRKSAEGSREIRGKTLGIIGYGHIGHQLGVLAEGMGMQVCFYDIEEKLPLGNTQAADNLDQLLAQSDLVSLHVPQTPETANMIRCGRTVHDETRLIPGQCLQRQCRRHRRLGQGPGFRSSAWRGDRCFST